MVCVGGLSLVVIPLALGSLGKATKAQHVLDGARPIVAPPFLEQEYESGLRTAVATEALITGPVFTELAAALNETPAQFQAYVTTSFPAVATGQQQAATIEQLAAGILANLQLHQHDFQLADSIPVHGMPLDAGVWTVLAMGAVVAAAGVWLWLRPSAWPAGIVALVLGLGFVIFAFVTNVPDKSAAAHRVIASVTIGRAKNQLVRSRFNIVNGAFTQFNDQLIPAVAARLGATPASLQQQLTSSVPDLRADLAQLPAILGHFDEATTFRERNLGNFNAVRNFPFETVVWVELGVGAVIGLAGVAAVATAVADRRRG